MLFMRLGNAKDAFWNHPFVVSSNILSINRDTCTMFKYHGL